MFNVLLMCCYAQIQKPIKNKSNTVSTVQPEHKVLHKDKFLEQAVQGLLENNHGLISLQHKVIAKMYTYNQKRGELLPRIDLVGSVQQDHQNGAFQDLNSQVTNSLSNQWSYGVDMNYLLFDGFSTMNAAKAQDFEVQSVIYEFQEELTKEIVNLIETILSIQSAELQVEIGQRDVERKKKMAAEAGNRVETGAVGKDNGLQAQASLQESISSLNKAQSDLLTHQTQFQQYTGMSYKKTPWIGFPEEALKNLDALESNLDKTNFSVLKAKASMQKAQKDKKATDGDIVCPKITLELGARSTVPESTTTNERDANIRSIPKHQRTDYSLVVKGKINLFAGGSKKSEALSKSNLVASARSAFLGRAQQVLVEFKKAKTQFLTAQHNNELFANARKSFIQVYDILFDRYKSGAINFSELNSIAESLHRAELALINNEKEQRLAAWKLLQLTGRITPKTMVASMGKDFNPFSEYNKIKSRI